MRIHVITIFPEVMESIFGMGMLGVATRKGIVTARALSPREFATDAHRTVDDTPCGGGAGMVMMAPPVVEAVESLGLREGSPVILTTPAGKRFDQKMAARFAAQDELTFICGRYKAVDERVRELVVSDEVSVGDFVLSGGELAAAVCIEATVRLLGDVLGNEESGHTDSFAAGRDGLLDCAWYTRPVEYRGHTVPDVLMSGHHAEIEKWRRASSLERTQKYRPDLITRGERGTE